MIPWREEGDSRHGISGEPASGLFGRGAASARGYKEERQPEPAAAVAGGVMDGMNRTEAARIGGMDRQTLRDWVHRFNAQVRRASGRLVEGTPSRGSRGSSGPSS